MITWVYNFIYNKREEKEQKSLTKEVIESIREHNPEKEEVKTMGMTIAESLVEKGIIQDKHKLIIKALSKRFQDIPDEIAEKIKTINDPDKLDTIFDAIFEIETIDQIYSLF